MCGSLCSILLGNDCATEFKAVVSDTLIIPLWGSHHSMNGSVTRALHSLPVCLFLKMYILQDT